MTDNPPVPASVPASTTPGDSLLDVMNGNLGALNERMGVEFLEVAPERIVARMPVEGNTQPYGLLHGGASVVLAETLGSVGASLAAGPGRAAVGIDINATHHRAARSGWVTGTATPISIGSTLVSYQITIRDEADRLLCTSRITCMVRDRPPAS
jgi:1,4-dihydroxy-2-naphthoyl-CoA hydrolase